MSSDHNHDASIVSCKRVVEEGAPILFISHDRDGDWQILCGGNEHDDPDNIRFVCSICAMDRHPELVKFQTLPLGSCAERDNAESQNWKIFEIDEEEAQ